jgi:pyrroloquinoline quinone (PQQ) biosynthesis protein C
MKNLDRLHSCFISVLASFNQSPALQRLSSGNITIEHYKSYLRQIYHYTKDNPQIQALATVYFRGDDRDLVKMFYKHAISEIGHDMLALRDLETLGEDTSRIRTEYPLPATIALNAFVYWQIYNHNPIGYLGYLFFLEFLPTSSGNDYMRLLEGIGVPKEAMAFILEHATVDVAHNKLMEKYAEHLIHTESDLDAVIYAMRATGKLYSDMLLAAFEQADNPQDWGVNPIESERISR